MPPSKKLKKPKKDPLVLPPAPKKMGRGGSSGLPRKIWVFRWTWTLDPNVRAADIRFYKKMIVDYCKKKLLKFNIRNGTKYRPIPKWGKIIKIGNGRKMTVQFSLSPVPPKPVGGGAGLPPPVPKQPPPPPIG